MASKFMYQKEVWHNGLNKYKVVKAQTQYELDQKVRALRAQWNEQWKNKCLAEQKKQERMDKIASDEDANQYAKERTENADYVQNQLNNILINSINTKLIEFNDLMDHTEFEKECPQQPAIIPIPAEPQRNSELYNPKASFFTKMIKKKYQEHIAQNDEKFNQDWCSWIAKKKDIESKNNINQSKYHEEFKQWEAEKKCYLENQDKENNKIVKLEEDFNSGVAEAIDSFYLISLQKIELPIEYDKEVYVDFSSDSKMLIVDLSLPIIENLPKLKKVNYVKSRSEFSETQYPDAYIKKQYDSVLYQIVLQHLNYIFQLDNGHDYIEAVTLNGFVSTIDKTTGKNIEPCILSVNVTKKDFMELNLLSIDPKAWFKSAKGISAASFATITPVAPAITMSKEDNRFIQGYSVADSLDESINLASIDWKDFENLIREIFEQEFNINGGEVKITQASRDGGVDAVAFDPDPIRGGKIVIQAKRYTNTVGVSAVRDLYGTVMNEGATKGILVTTSNYGNDAYSFANGKPLTLMNGANLLALMEKHGHKAKIDLKEAKEILRESN